jgi:hypothetical protein
VSNAPASNTVQGLTTLDPSNVTSAEKVASIVKVEYYRGETLIQAVEIAPFALNTDKLENGDYTITERTYFDDGSVSEKTQDITVANVAAKATDGGPSDSKLVRLIAGSGLGLVLLGLLGFGGWRFRRSRSLTRPDYYANYGEYVGGNPYAPGTNPGQQPQVYGMVVQPEADKPKSVLARLFRR